MDKCYNSANPIDFFPYIDYYYTTILTQMVIDYSTTKNQIIQQLFITYAGIAKKNKEIAAVNA